MAGGFFLPVMNPLLAQTVVEAPAISLDTMQVCIAAGVGTWVIPIIILALFRVARKGASTGGSVL